MLITTFKICAFITGILGCVLVSCMILEYLIPYWEAFKRWID